MKNSKTPSGPVKEWFIILLSAVLVLLTLITFTTYKLKDKAKYLDVYPTLSDCRNATNTGCTYCGEPKGNICYDGNYYADKGYVATKNQIQPTPTPNLDLSAPDLPKDRDWTVVEKNQQKINYIKWSENKDSTVFGYIPLSGKEWVSYIQLEKEGDFETYGIYLITKILKKTGWKETFSYISPEFGTVGVLVNGLILSAGQPSLPTQFSHAYFKRVGNNMRVISLFEKSDENALYKGVGSVDYKFPHICEYRVFVSDILNVDEVLSQKVKTDVWLFEKD